MKVSVNKSSQIRFDEVTISEPTVGDILEAQEVSGKDDGTAFAAAMIAKVCTFDGKQLTYEDVQRLPISSFLELNRALEESGILTFDEQHSTLSERDDSHTKM